MEIRNLKDISDQVIVDCLLLSFADYFVKMPDDINFWRNRFIVGRVDFEFSFGAFDNGNLVGFILNGIDQHLGQLTAYNSGTGVLPHYRGRHLVDQIYSYAMPFLKKKGIEKCLLEVIQKNDRAIRVYERIGFHIIRNLKCFKGEIESDMESVRLEKIDFASFLATEKLDDSFYSWDNKNEGILCSPGIYDSYTVWLDELKKIGHFTINAKSGYLVQFEAEASNIAALFAGIRQLNAAIRINNVDDRRIELLQSLENLGLVNTIDQYEMEMKI